MSLKIGVLDLQGAVREHAKAISACGQEVVLVKKKEQLAELDGLVLPGGESTTMRRLIDRYDFLPSLQAFAKGKCVFGTCAGMILLAKEIVGYDKAHIGAMDIKVMRNAFGRQCESFEMNMDIKEVGDNFPAVFIRAPYVESTSANVEVLAELDGHPVAVKQGHLLAAAFHPELTNDYRMMEYFIQMVKEKQAVPS